MRRFQGYIFAYVVHTDCLAFSESFMACKNFKMVVGLDINNWSKTIFVLPDDDSLVCGYCCRGFKAAYQAIQREQTEARLVLV